MQRSWRWNRFGSALLVALTLLLGASPVATGAQDDDVDCFEFTFQEEAQEEFEADPSDPYNLDPNDDGIACALLPSADDAEDATPEASPDFQNDDEALDAEPATTDQTIEATQDDNSNDDNNNGGNNNGGGNGGGGNGGRNRNPDDATATADANGNDRPNRNRDRNQNNNDDVICDDFTTEEEAQAELDADDTLAATLDTNDDGFACSDGDDVDLPTEDELADEDATGAFVCDDFVTEEEAQAELDADDTLAASLDGNDDGFACSEGDDVDLPSEAELADDTGGAFACDDYDTQAEAQAAYDVDPDLLIDLDSNGDGLACSDGDDVNLDDADDTVVTVDAGGDVDCIDFDTQEEAQAVYDATAGDPNNLDPSNDGFACSELPSEDGTVRVSSIPNTGTGGATSSVAGAWWLPLSVTLAFAALAARVAAAGTRRSR